MATKDCRTQASFAFDRSRLALSYDAQRLQGEVSEALAGMPPYIYYNVVPLTVACGHNPGVKDFSDPDWTVWEETRLLKRCAAIQDVLDSLECRKTNIRLMRLEAGAVVQEHTDPQLDLDLQNQVRLHVPIFADERVDFLLNGRKVPLRPGELW